MTIPNIKMQYYMQAKTDKGISYFAEKLATLENNNMTNFEEQNLI